ncbi:MAG: hypothetical protein N4A74_20770 [Carboxylicivirga sp.]|nr:hypothetical protein [Carboxylicivirga sp.]
MSPSVISGTVFRTVGEVAEAVCGEMAGRADCEWSKGGRLRVSWT